MSDKRGITRVIRTPEEFEAAHREARETAYRPKPWQPEPVPENIIKALVGWTILGVTRDPTPHVEGGLCLFLSCGDRYKAVSLGYTELGEWLEREWQVEKPT